MTYIKRVHVQSVMRDAASVDVFLRSVRDEVLHCFRQGRDQEVVGQGRNWLWDHLETTHGQ